MANILLIEDDEAIREGLSFSFDQAKHTLYTAQNIKEAGMVVNSTHPDLILLDISLPDGNGFDFYREVLCKLEIPVIFLTAKDAENDIVCGLESGAEDYITKPFSTRELMARVNRVLMRKQKTFVLKVQDVTFDPDKMEVRKNGEILSFSKIEIRIIQLLFSNCNKVVSRNAVIDLIWEATGNDVYDHTVTVYINRIRDKLGSDVIKTVKGVGYLIDTKS